MKNVIKMILILAVVSGNASAQKALTKNGNISFYSDASLEKIEAHNKQVNVAFDMTTGDVVFKVLIKSFEFEKALMQEHFNENYLESDKYPNATYKGKVTNLSEIDFKKNGVYKVVTEGELMIHGISKNIKEPGSIEIKDNKIIIVSNFYVSLKDFNVKIPSNLIKNIAERIKVTVNAPLDKMIQK